MQKQVAAITALLTLPLLAGGAFAQQEERYRLERTENGYVRMDTQTGVMTLCQERSGELVCRPAADESRAGSPASPDSRALRERLAALEARVEALENAAEGSVPTEEEFEQTLGLMERFFRRFVDIVRGLESEEQQQEQAPGGSADPAQRT